LQLPEACPHADAYRSSSDNVNAGEPYAEGLSSAESGVKRKHHRRARNGSKPFKKHPAVSKGVRRLGKRSLCMDMRAFVKVQRLLL
jgi:hypothetical protein